MRTFMVFCMVVVAGGPACGDVLWDQPPTGENDFKDLEYGDFPDMSCYMVVDVDTGPGWTISSVRTYYTHGSGFWGPGMMGRLNIFERTGVLPDPGDDPTAGLLVDVTVENDGLITTVTASDLAIDVGAGEHWVGLTPVGDFSEFGSEFHLDSPLFGGPSAWNNPGGGYGLGAGWQSLPLPGYSYEDPAIRIEGTVIPEPGSLGLLALAGLAVLRRR